MRLTIATEDEPTLNEILRRIDNTDVGLEDIKMLLSLKGLKAENRKRNSVTVKSYIGQNHKKRLSFTLSKGDKSNDDN